MENLVEIWEQYLEDAIEIKNKKPLHHLLVSLADNIVQRSVYEKHLIEIKSEIRILTENMQRGFELVEKRFEAVEKRFEAVDKRFEAVDKRFEDLYHYMDKRFEDMNKRFSMMFAFMNIGFGIIVLITVLFKFLKFP